MAHWSCKLIHVRTTISCHHMIENSGAGVYTSWALVAVGELVGGTPMISSCLLLAPANLMKWF